MEKRELEINKNNYEGYTKLYKIKSWSDNYEAIIPALTGLFLGTIVLAILIPELMLPAIYLFGIESIATTPIALAVYRKNKERKKLKKQYPYLNYKVSKRRLKKSLEKVGIVKEDKFGNRMISTKNYENYIKYEEEKKKYIQEEKRNYSTFINYPELHNEKKDKVLVKTPRYLRKTYK